MPSRLGYGLYKKIDRRLKDIFRCQAISKNFVHVQEHENTYASINKYSILF